MQARGPSRTARNTAIWRAVHNILDEEPKILSDPFARDLAGYSSDEALLTAHNAHPLAHIPWLRTQFALRNRYAEDELLKAVKRDIEQYVILGAGLDSFAYRHPELMQSLDVYEVDHPASQEWKRQQIAKLGLAVPSRLHYAPVDFEHQTLTQGLHTAGLNRQKPVFFSWLGVTQYLSRDAVLRTLREVAALSAKGSTLVMEFIAPASSLSEDDAALVRALAEGTARVGEPWLSYFTSAEMDDALRQSGFHTTTHFGSDEACSRYLKGRTDGSRLPGYFRMTQAST